MEEDDSAAPDPVALAVAALGEPEREFAVSLGRLTGRLTLAGLLLVYGVAGNAFWWAWGPAKMNHFTLLALIAPPLTGVSILRHIHRMRGLRALVFPSGLLRVHGRLVESFPWDDVVAVRLKVPSARFELERTEAGPVGGGVLWPAAPRWKIGEAWVSVERSDGVTAEFTPALADFAELAAEAQRRTFARLHGAALARIAAGEPAWFGPFALSEAGVFWADEVVPWAEVDAFVAASGRLVLKRRGRWVTSAKSAALEEVANPHVALAVAAGRSAT